MNRLKQFAQNYIDNLLKEEDVIVKSEIREHNQSMDFINPITFEVHKSNASNLMIEIADRIQKEIQDLEPTNTMFFLDKVVIGVCNPLPSKRKYGELYKSKIRIIIEKFPQDDDNL